LNHFISPYFLSLVISALYGFVFFIQSRKDLTQHLFINSGHELFLILINVRLCPAGLNWPLVLCGTTPGNRRRLDSFVVFPMVFYPALAIVMTADAGKNQPPVSLQADKAKTAGEVVFTTVPESMLAIVGASAFRFFMQGVILQVNKDLLGPPGNNPLIFTDLGQGL